MTLAIETFSNRTGGNIFYKAISHPLAAEAIGALLRDLAGRPLAIYDPHRLADGFAALHDLNRLDVTGVYGQAFEHLGAVSCGHAVRPVTELPTCDAVRLLVLAFDADRIIATIRHLVPATLEIRTLDEARLPADMLTVPDRYLDPLNFATNLAFFRDDEDGHTRLGTANYWTRYGAAEVSLWCRLFGSDGAVLATWREAVGPGAIAIDSRAVRERFGLPAFMGQLFLHATGVRGHDVVKYALDTIGKAGHVAGASLSCTHDANAWPADLYAGLPAPAPGERVLLWLQNSHPAAIPPGSIGLAQMDSPEDTVLVDRPIAPFATLALDLAELFPSARWPRQFELRAGRHLVRPRYEVVGRGRRRIAHVNVERTDSRPDPDLPRLGPLMGKGHILPAPILPPARWRVDILPTPMATCQRELPLALLVYDAMGRPVVRRPLGRLPRDGCRAIDLDSILAEFPLPTAWGHAELVYDFANGGEADGWLHAIFRYHDRRSGHAAETSFGSHIFNTALTHRGEPQSYSGPPPGLSTRLFLRLGFGRLGPEPLDTLCHLIYPASTPWHAHSSTDLILHDFQGREVARRSVAIPCSGSLLWRFGETFDGSERRQAGDGGYVVIRDTTCRLFGYAGLTDGDGAFSFDHLFGF
jgi:hypothetical protein